MKKNTFINQSIWSGVWFVLIALLHTSCDYCQPVGLERDRDTEIAKITIDKQESIGYINGVPMVKVEGNITEKHIPETSKLCLLVIPKGGEVRSAIREFQAANKELGYGNKEVSRVPLPKSKGKVYYAKDVKAPEQGSVSASVWVDQLAPGTYESCLLLHTERYGTVFSNTHPLEIPSPDAADPSISMVDAKPARDLATQATKIHANANIQNYVPQIKEGWFLFVKKDMATDLKFLIAGLLESGKRFPTDKKFMLLADGKTIIHPFANPVAPANTLDASDDADPSKKIFERGATYKVYACFVGTNKTDGCPAYGISDSKEITILKPEVELNIKEVKITLIKCLDVPAPNPSVDELSVAYEAEITKQAGTFNPEIGLLFVKGARVGKEVGIQKIQGLLRAAAPVDGYYLDGTDVAYLIGNDTTKLQATITTPSVPLELGETYHVYFFLKDGGGEVFVSGNEVAMTVPNASLNANGFGSSRKDGIHTKIKWRSLHSNISEYTGAPEKRGSGFILLEDGKTLEASFLEQILANAEADRSDDPAKKPKYKAQIGDEHCNFVDVKRDGKFNLEACLSVYSRLTDKKTIQHVCQVAFGEHVVFWKTLTGEKLTFYPTDKPDRESMPINENLWKKKGSYTPGSKYRYLKFDEDDPNAEIVFFKVDDANKHNEVRLPYSDAQDALFRDLLACIIDGDDPQEVKDTIDSFINKMKNP